MKKNRTYDVSPARIPVPCLGEVHYIFLAENGHISFPNHPQIDAEVVGNKLGGNCSCAVIYELIKNINKYSTPLGIMLREVGSVYGANLYIREADRKLDQIRKYAANVQSARTKQALRQDYLERVDYLSPRSRAVLILAQCAASQGNIIANAALLRVGESGKIVNNFDRKEEVILPQDWVQDVYKRGISCVDGYLVLSVNGVKSENRLRVELLSNQGKYLCHRFADITRKNNVWSLSPQNKEYLEKKLSEWK